MITYYLTLSQVFPSTHCRAEEPTYFREKLLNEIENRLMTPVVVSRERLSKDIICNTCENITGRKVHTIRANYDFWARRFEKIAAGEAVLSIREWVGKPYGKGSTQREIIRLTRDDGIGLQRLDFAYGTLSTAWIDWGKRRLSCPLELLALNDGLSLNDWREWFKGYDLSKPLAIIHFTNFRY